MGAFLGRLLGFSAGFAHVHWGRLVRALLRLIHLRRLWSALGTHLKRYKALKSKRPGDNCDGDF